MASGAISMFSENMDYEGTLSWASYTTASSNTSTIVFTFKIHKRTYPMVTCPFYVGLYVGTPNGATLDRLRGTETPVFSVGTDDVTVYTHTSIVPHDQDGKKTIEVFASIYRADTDETEGVSTWYLKGVNSDGIYVIERETDMYYLTLDTIVRKANITSAPDITDQTSNATIKYTNPMGSKVSSLQVCIANETGNTILVPYRDVSLTGSSYTFQLSSTERQALVNNVTSGDTATIRFYIKTTIYELTHYHFVPKTYKLTSAMPTISPTVADMNDITKALTGDYNTLIKYYSNAAVSINAVAKAGATIKSCRVDNGSFSSTNQNGIFLVERVDSGTFKVSATDSRGNTVSQTITKTLVPYEPVSCNLSVDMELVGSTSAAAYMHIKGNYYNGSFGKSSNSIHLEYRKTNSQGTWDSWTTISVPTSAMSDGKYSLTQSVTGLDYRTQYKFQCRVSDALSNSTTDAITTTLQPVFDWSGSDFNFNVPVSFQGDFLDDFVIEHGTTAMGSNGTWYWSKWKSGKAECYGVRNYGNMAFSTAVGPFYRSAKFNQELPSGVFWNMPSYIGITLHSNSSGWVVRDVDVSPFEDKSGTFYIMRPTSGNSSAVNICFHVIGRWQ